MNHSEKDRLLRAILDDESVDRLREASLTQGLGMLRARRRRRAAIASGLASMAVAAALIVAFQLRNPLPVATSRTPAPVSHIKLINDDELLALFPNRPVALIGAPGDQRLIFLDAPAASVLRGEKR